MSSSDEEEETNCTDEEVFTKYKTASEIANKTLQGCILNCKAGKTALEICQFGDKVIKLQTDKVYKKSKTMKKGIAFPTSVSVNNCVCHYSPLSAGDKVPVLKAGDMVKIDLGVHIDGYIAVVAHTIIVEQGAAPVTGPQADLLKAAAVACEAAHKLIRPGAKSSTVTAAFKNIGGIYGVTACEGVLTHQTKRFVIDGNKVIIGKEQHDQKVDEFDFELGEVYAVDICLSTGDGKPKEMDSRTTIYKKVVDSQYRLKRKSSRYVLNEVNKNFPTLPFSLRNLSDVSTARAGVIECVKNDLLTPYHVLYEKDGVHVVHFKFTVLLRASGTMRMTGDAASKALYKGLTLETDKVHNDELKKVLALSTKRKKRRKKRGKKKKKPAAAAAAAPGALTEAQIAAAKAKFDELDVDKSGTLKGHEMKQLADMIEVELGRGGHDDKFGRRDDRLGKSIMALLDADGSGSLTFEEFLKWYKQTNAELLQFVASHDSNDTATPPPAPSS